MNSMILESPTAAKSFNIGTLAGTNFHSMLKESIERFLIEVQKDSCDFTAFRSIFFRLLQSSIDPPLEVIWFYSALGYHEAIRTKRDVTDRIFAIRDLLHLLSAFSASCDGPKSMALLAPVVSELYHCLGEEKKLSGKVAKKFRKEIENLAEGVVSYISICSGRRSGEQELCDGYLVLDDIIRVWTVQHSEKVKVDHFSILFPFLSEQIRYSLRQQGRGLSYLAGAVVAGAFLLSLSLKVQVDGLLLRPDSQKELRIWAVSSISMFQNYYFFDMLLRILLLKSQEPMLTARSTDEGLARNVLYDAVILVDYSFTNPGVEVENFNDSLMNLLMRRLIVIHEAIQIVRGKGDHNKAISYTNAFATSCVSNALIKWVTFQVGSKKLNKPNTNAPQGLLKWFLVLEKQGFKLFEDEISELLSKLAFEESSVGPMSKKVDSDSERTVADIYIDDRRWPDNDAAVDEEMETVDAAFRFDSCSERTDDDLYSDDKRWPDNDAAEDEEMETVDAAFRSAALSMKSEKSRERKKRKEKTYEEDLSQLKLVRYKSQDKSVKDNFNKSAADGMSSGSEVEDPSTVDEMAE